MAFALFVLVLSICLAGITHADDLKKIKGNLPKCYQCARGDLQNVTVEPYSEALRDDIQNHIHTELYWYNRFHDEHTLCATHSLRGNTRAIRSLAKPCPCCPPWPGNTHTYCTARNVYTRIRGRQLYRGDQVEVSFLVREYARGCLLTPKPSPYSTGCQRMSALQQMVENSRGTYKKMFPGSGLEITEFAVFGDACLYDGENSNRDLPDEEPVLTDQAGHAVTARALWLLTAISTLLLTYN